MPKKKKLKPAKSSPVVKGMLLTIIIIGLGSSLYFFLKSGEKHPPVAYTEHVASLPKVEAEIQVETSDLPPEPPVSTLPKVAIIIDDIGHRKKLALDIIALDMNLSFSVLPQSPFADVLAKKILSSGKDLLLHLPLEPSDSKWDPGPGALMLAMTPATIRTRLQEDLSGFTFIGMNNHMGSKFTADKKAMHGLLSIIKDKNLFFVDSLTSAKSVAYASAQELGIKTAKRDIFLDNEQTPKAIQKQFEKLIAIANKRGSAIGIGHPYPATLKALTASQKILASEVELVGIHKLVK